jgi:rhodanese-related sulfurtransferase
MNHDAVNKITPSTLKQWLHDGQEVAVLDVREHGQYGEEHLFYIVSVPYSKLEIEVARLVPRKNVRMVLVGDEHGTLTSKAHRRLDAMGYQSIHILDGGMPAWKKAGFEVFAGVNLPSKAFGELAEHAFNTPRITALELNEKIAAKENMVILDGRPFSEYKKMSIPTAVCCPNGELALRIDEIAPDPETTIVINCAGRTRSIIGAQTLINLGIPNKVLALENGTQGWYLQDLVLDHGQTRKYPEQINAVGMEVRQSRARTLAEKHNVQFVDRTTVHAWLKDHDRTTFLCDVRTPEEYAKGTLPGAQHTPGGQLVQATDQYVGVKGARLVLIDQEGVRAPAMASWLAMLGWEVAVWRDAFNHASAATQNGKNTESTQRISAFDSNGDIKQIGSEQIAALMSVEVNVIDLRPSMTFREAHILGAVWSIRPNLSELTTLAKEKPVLLIAENLETAQLASIDLREIGVKQIYVNIDTPSIWKAANLPLASTPNTPSNEQCIDYLFFVHDRHDGNKAAARQYLAWEMNLLAQIDEQEKNTYKLPH